MSERARCYAALAPFFLDGTVASADLISQPTWQPPPLFLRTAFPRAAAVIQPDSDAATRTATRRPCVNGLVLSESRDRAAANGLFHVLSKQVEPPAFATAGAADPAGTRVRTGGAVHLAHVSRLLGLLGLLLLVWKR